MYRHAIIKNNIVTSIIKSTDEFAASLSGTVVKVENDATISTGHTYDGSTFTAPVETEPTLNSEEWGEHQKRWRNKELTYTDAIVPVTDLPDYDSWMTYRVELRDWPSTAAFPHDRPYPLHMSASVSSDKESWDVISDGVKL